MNQTLTWQASQPPAGVAAAPGLRATNRLEGVDGLRAIAALWVVFFHIHAFSGAKFAHVPGLDLFLRSGSTGVSLFLVLSGFCLYLPFAGGRTGRFKTGEFFRRRCRRLMPAYYVSLAFALVVSLTAATWLGLAHLSLSEAAWQIFTHATLTHTLFPSTFYALNGAYWSLGLEWQLYLGLPLLVWGIRRFGLAKTVTAVVLCSAVYRLAVGMAIDHDFVARNSDLATAVLPNQLPGRWAEFAYGMVAAELYVTGRTNRWADKVRWMVPVLLVLIPTSVLVSGSSLSHLLYGCVFFVLLSVVLAQNNLVSRICSWKPLVVIGTMSYSLYLVHQPVVESLAYWARAHGGATRTETFFLLVLALPLIMLLGWVLFMTVERRTLTSKPLSNSSASDVAVFSEPTLPLRLSRQLSVWGLRGIRR